MAQRQKIHFTKMHGAGNDYIYVDTSLFPIDDPAAAAIAWSDRHKGIGADGLVLIGRPSVPEADYSMRIFNADGSEARMCGNAARCIGKYVYEKGLTEKTEIRLLTMSGVKTLRLQTHPRPLPMMEGSEHLQGQKLIVESVTVDMGEPEFENEKMYIPAKDPIRRDGTIYSPPSQGGVGGGSSGVFVSMGNPHYVIFTDNVDRVEAIGSRLECHEAFPERCNIELAASLMSPQGGKNGEAFRMRVWERGSGVTMACGTGACATAVAACLTGRAGRKSSIVMDGGRLDIEWLEADRPGEGCFFQKNHIYMSGPAEFVFEGEI